MKLIALMPVRNESWVLGCSLRVALMWCDSVVVLDHASTDSTPAILEEISTEYPGRVTILKEPDPAWPEMAHRQKLLEQARTEGATHIALVDADEILTGNLLGSIRGEIEKLQPGEALDVAMLAMWRSLDRYRIGQSIWANRYDLTLAFRDAPELRWASVNGYDHHSRAPQGIRVRVAGPRLGGVMHLQWASWRRLLAKHAAYKMHERLSYPLKSVAEIDYMYSLALNELWLQTVEAPPEWWEPYRNLRAKIDLDDEPWQERQCREWAQEYGRERFTGLDLFDVIG